MLPVPDAGGPAMLRSSIHRIAFFSVAGFLAATCAAEQPAGEKPAAKQKVVDDSPDRHAKLESALSKMLSGATLEGSFTSTGAGSDPSKLSREKYTLGEVRYLGYGQLILGVINIWLPEYGLYFWAAGFGVLHIVYGLVMWYRYEK